MGGKREVSIKGRFFVGVSTFLQLVVAWLEHYTGIAEVRV